MGQQIDNICFSDQQFFLFEQRLQDNLSALETLLARPKFGEGPSSLGAELEVYLVDANGKPAYCNQELQQQANDPLLTVELNRYNLEYNFAPLSFNSRVFSQLESQFRQKLQQLNRVGQSHNVRIVPIGILPTLTRHDFGEHAMTSTARYERLTEGLKRLRKDQFHIAIDGADPLSLDADTVTLEGANTSMQIHYRLPLDQYVDFYNAVQLVTPIALGVAANSPMFIGHRLWQETRIALFKQAIDSRQHNQQHGDWHTPPRVVFGQGWLRQSPYELFAEAVSLYPPLLPMVSDEDPLAAMEQGNTPALNELRLHQSTVWNWNRPVFDPVDGGHLRIELRALPAGPSPVDMVANAAFTLGLAKGLAANMPYLLPAMPFQYAKYNFYRAAQFGLQAKLVWPNDNSSGVSEKPLLDIAKQLLPIAAHGLELLDIDRDEANYYLNIIEQRIAQQCNGAQWQLAMLDKLSSHYDQTSAQQRLLECYIDNVQQGLPVSQWSMSL